MTNPFSDGSFQVDCDPDEFSINFIGKEVFYSNQTLRSLQIDFCMAAYRYETVADVPQAAVSNVSTGRIIVVDQMMLEDLLTRPAAYRQAAGCGSLAFAYRKEESARRLFEKWDRGENGNIGYLPMNVAPDVWQSILRLLVHEELYLPCFLADCVASLTPTPCRIEAPARQSTSRHPVYAKLTPREKQVLQLVSKGQSNKIIAANLGITEHTVKLHMHNVVGKIGVSNRTAAAQFFFELTTDDAQALTVD